MVLFFDAASGNLLYTCKLTDTACFFRAPERVGDASAILILFFSTAATAGSPTTLLHPLHSRFPSPHSEDLLPPCIGPCSVFICSYKSSAASTDQSKLVGSDLFIKFDVQCLMLF